MPITFRQGNLAPKNVKTAMEVVVFQS